MQWRHLPKKTNTKTLEAADVELTAARHKLILHIDHVTYITCDLGGNE